MPFLQMHMIEGRPQEKKKELIAELTETVCRVLEVDPGAVRVELVEVLEVLEIFLRVFQIL